MKRIIIFRAAAILALVIIAAVMLVIGRGHTVYFDNRTLEYNGQEYKAPFRVVVNVDGEEAARLAARERGMSVCIGQTIEFSLTVMQEEDGEEAYYPVSLNLPYSMDGIIFNLPAYLAGLPTDAYMTEFVPTPEAEPEEEEVPLEGDMPLEDEMLGDI